MSRAPLALALGAALVLWGCSSPPPPAPRPAPEVSREAASVHVVRAGENLYRISQQYGTTVEAIARINRIRNPHQLAAGQRLLVPSGVAPAAARSGGAISRGGGVWGAIDPRGRTAGKPVFIWPLGGSISSGFGFRNGAHHDGIDIPARKGTPVRAAESGRVIHSDNALSGYGHLVIIKHAGRLSTVYAHNRRNLVRQGEFVEKGQVIAEVGDTGRASAPHLHFEVRDNGSPRNPLNYLP